MDTKRQKHHQDKKTIKIKKDQDGRRYVSRLIHGCRICKFILRFVVLLLYFKIFHSNGVASSSSVFASRAVLSDARNLYVTDKM